MQREALATETAAARAESKTDSGPGPGDWTEDDRRRKTERWKQACEYNLLRGANSEYTEVVQRRDFYWWFYDAIVAKGGETRWWPNVPWVDVDYKQVKPMITACASTRNTVNGAFWRKVFIDICDDDNITEAVDDLGLAEPERSEWIKEEKAIF